MQLLGVLTKAGTGLLGFQHCELAAYDRVRELAHGGGRGDLGRPELEGTRDHQAHGEQAGLELRECRGLQPARHTQLLDERLECVDPLGAHFDLDPAQLHGPLTAADDDHGVIERDLGRIDAADAQRKGAPPGAHLKHLA